MEMHVAFGDVQEGYDVVEKVGEVCRKNLWGEIDRKRGAVGEWDWGSLREWKGGIWEENGGRKWRFLLSEIQPAAVIISCEKAFESRHVVLECKIPHKLYRGTRKVTATNLRSPSHRVRVTAWWATTLKFSIYHIPSHFFTGLRLPSKSANAVSCEAPPAVAAGSPATPPSVLDSLFLAFDETSGALSPP